MFKLIKYFSYIKLFLFKLCTFLVHRTGYYMKIEKMCKLKSEVFISGIYLFEKSLREDKNNSMRE